jgi:transposase-like protein
LAVCVPGDRPVRAGHRRLRLATAGRRFFEQAIATTKVSPTEVVTDRAPTYPLVLEELLPAAWRQTERYANNGIVRRARRGDLMPDRRLGFSLR